MDLEYLVYLQEVRMSAPFFITQIFVALSNLVSSVIPLLLAGIMYWSVDKKYGIYMFVNYGGGLHINQFMKGCACVSRPWIKDPRIMPYRYVEDYSFPSGHACIATTTYGTIGLWARRKAKLLVVPCVLLVFLSSYSRNWLGMHTLQDVAAAIGITLLWMYLANRILLWIEENPKQDILIATLGCAVTILITEFLVYKSYPIMQATYGKLVPNGPEGSVDTMYTCGLCLGFLIGWLLERRIVHFECKGTLKRRVIRSAVGVVVTLFEVHVAENFFKLFFKYNTAALLTTFSIALTITFICPAIMTVIEKRFEKAPVSKS